MAEWLHFSIRRIVTTLGPVSAIEIFSSLYSTIVPWESLPHEQIFSTLEELCGEPQQRGKVRQFSLAALREVNR